MFWCDRWVHFFFGYVYLLLDLLVIWSQLEVVRTQVILSIYYWWRPILHFRWNAITRDPWSLRPIHGLVAVPYLDPFTVPVVENPRGWDGSKELLRGGCNKRLFNLDEKSTYVRVGSEKGGVVAVCDLWPRTEPSQNRRKKRRKERCLPGTGTMTWQDKTTRRDNDGPIIIMIVTGAMTWWW